MDIHHSKEKELFFKAVLSLETVEECDKFFEDICTIKEMQDLSQRMNVAVLLSEGRVYNDIVKLTGASSATICRVNRCLKYGTGGYNEILERIKDE